MSDLQRSRAFYERLGWKPVNTKDDPIVIFQAGGIALVLYPRVDLAKDADVPPDGAGFRAITLAYNTPSHGEVDSFSRLRSQQVRSCSKLRRKPSGEVIPGTSLTQMVSFGSLREILFVVSEDGSTRIRHGCVATCSCL